MNWKSWLQGLFFAIAAGVGGGLTFALTDPEHFNFGNGGGMHLLSLSIAFGLLAAGGYLKDSRPPSWKDSIPTVADLKKGAGVGVILLACALGAGAMSMPACASTQPPAGTYSPVGTKAYNADQLMKDLRALGQTARNLNAVSGAEHLSDLDTKYVRDFSLIAGAGLYAYGQGSTSLATAKAALDTLPPGYLPAAYLVPAKAAFDRAVIDHGAGASALYVVVDVYKTLRQQVSVSATKNPKLTLVLGAVDAGIAAIPLQ